MSGKYLLIGPRLNRRRNPSRKQSYSTQEEAQRLLKSKKN